ncbi:MAG: ASPIC/UnbV domain-containing protein, partial [Myxococcaceae bacterium]
FSDVTFSAGVGHLQKANGVSFADIDGDGDLELAAQVGGFYQDDAFGNVLFENPGNANHWISIELRGLRDNYFGLGARIRAHLTQGNLESDVYTTMTTGGSSGCNPMCAHLGLGNADQIEFIEIHWPASGETQRIKNVGVDRLITIKQSENKSEIRSRPTKK